MNSTRPGTDDWLSAHNPPKTASEPVAWRMKNSRGNWMYYDVRQVNGDLKPFANQQPLYTAPPAVAAPDAFREALTDALEHGLIYWEPNTERGHGFADRRPSRDTGQGG